MWCVLTRGSGGRAPSRGAGRSPAEKILTNYSGFRSNLAIFMPMWVGALQSKKKRKRGVAPPPTPPTHHTLRPGLRRIYEIRKKNTRNILNNKSTIHTPRQGFFQQGSGQGAGAPRTHVSVHKPGRGGEGRGGEGGTPDSSRPLISCLNHGNRV